MYGYHVTYERYFDDIAENGLEVRDTHEHNWNIKNTPGVYFWTNLRKALDWSFGGISSDPDKSAWRKCIIKFVVPDPEEVCEDYVWPDDECKFSMVPIPPENLVDVIAQDDFQTVYRYVRKKMKGG